MLKKFDHVSFEHVCSGIGIPNIYGYLRDVEHVPENPDVAKQIAAAGDPSFVIINHAFDPASPSDLCAATIDLFASILGSEAGNVALKVLATGGVYLGGGVVVHTLEALQGPRFMEYFKQKGRFAELMERIPIQVITTHAALVGAADYGLGNSMHES
jgi:glucokinase